MVSIQRLLVKDLESDARNMPELLYQDTAATFWVGVVKEISLQMAELKIIMIPLTPVLSKRTPIS